MTKDPGMSIAVEATLELRQRRAAVVQEHMAAEGVHDVDRVLATFSQPYYDVVPLGGDTSGEDAVRELLTTLFTAFPDFTAEAKSIRHGDDFVFVDTVISGTHAGPWAGVPATGRRMNVRCGCLFQFDGEQLTGETVYFDHATLLAQIGIGT